MSKGDESFQVSATLAAQRIVAVSAEGVFYPTNTSTPVIGVTQDTVLDTNSSIPVRLGGRLAKVLFNDTVAAGGMVAADSSGRGVPYTAATAATWYIGPLVGAAVAATGTIAEVLIQPGQASSE